METENKIEEWITTDSGKARYKFQNDEIIMADETSDIELGKYEDIYGSDIWKDGKIDQKAGKAKRLVTVIDKKLNSVCYKEGNGLISWITSMEFKWFDKRLNQIRFQKVQE